MKPTMPTKPKFANASAHRLAFAFVPSGKYSAPMTNGGSSLYALGDHPAQEAM